MTHVSFYADAGDLQHITDFGGLRTHLNKVCSELSRRIDRTASGEETTPDLRPDSHWAMLELLAIALRVQQLQSEVKASTDYEIPQMRWSPWGRIVVHHETGEGESIWRVPDLGTCYTDTEVSDWPCIGRIPAPIQNVSED